jgi:hypothetical protein
MQEEVARIGGNLSAEVKRFEHEGLNKLQAPLRRRLAQLASEITAYERDFLGPLSSEIEGNPSKSPLFVLSVDIPGHVVPVALAGSGTFASAVTGEHHDVTALLNIWPSAAGTQLSILVKSQYQRDVENYIREFRTPEFRVLSMIETWMVHGSDHWFLQPSVWKRIPQTRAEKILGDIADLSRNIGMEYERSIFDERRSEFLEGSIGRGLASGWSEFLELQRLKMTPEGCSCPWKSKERSRSLR